MYYEKLLALRKEASEFIKESMKDKGEFVLVDKVKDDDGCWNEDMYDTPSLIHYGKYDNTIMNVVKLYREGSTLFVHTVDLQEDDNTYEFSLDEMDTMVIIDIADRFL